jgi:hypothetical protein
MSGIKNTQKETGNNLIYNIPEQENKFDKDLDKWVGNLYTHWILDNESLSGLYNLHKYKGFDKEETLNDLKKLSDKEGPSAVVEIILICALKGPVQATQTKLSTGKTVSSYGIPKSVAKGSTGLSCNRITASTADLAAYYLKRLNIPKKMDIDLPGWLQFPSAASITLPERYINSHKEFAMIFSKRIGGEFNEDIYQQMRTNNYLNKGLRLFE